MELLVTLLGYGLITTMICLLVLQVVADINEVKRHAKHRALSGKRFRGRISLIVKAQNDQDTIIDCLDSIYASSQKCREVILLISNSTTDKTYNRACGYKRKNKLTNLKIINQRKRPQSMAEIIMKCAGSSIIGVIDARHILCSTTIETSLTYFNDHELSIVVPQTKTNVDNSFTSALVSLQTIMANYLKAATISIYRPGTGVFFRKRAILKSVGKLEFRDTKAVYASDASLPFSVATTLAGAAKMHRLSKIAELTAFIMLFPLTLLSLLFITGLYQELPVLQFTFLFLAIFTIIIVGTTKGLGLVQKISLVLFAPFAYIIFVLNSLLGLPSRVLLSLPRFGNR